MGRTSLPPGFRFHPTDIELILYFLKRKVMNKKLHIDVIAEVELYKYSPWDLPDKSCLNSKDLEWYFFCPRDLKYPKGSRTNRATENGYWKTSGKDRPILHGSRTVGLKKTLIFHEGKPPGGVRTDWVMYEFKLEDEDVVAAGFAKDAYVLCKIFKKSGLGPRIGEQYGAPFDEHEWDNVDDSEIVAGFPALPGGSTELAICASTEPLAHGSAVSAVLAGGSTVDPLGQHSFTSGESTVVATSAISAPLGQCSVVSGASTLLACSTIADPFIQHTVVSCGGEGVLDDTNHVACADGDLDPDEIDGMSLDLLAEYLNDAPFPPCTTDNEEFPGLPPISDLEARALQMHTDEIYFELEDLIAQPGGPSNTMSTDPKFEGDWGQVMAELEDNHYVELDDFFSIPSESTVPNDLTAQYSLEYCSTGQFETRSLAPCGTAPTAFMADGEAFATFPSFDDSASLRQDHGFEKSGPPFTSVPSFEDDGPPGNSHYWFN